MALDLALDRVILDVPDHELAGAAYARFLGREAGAEPRVSNAAVQLGRPAWAPRPGLVFSSEDYEGAVRLLTRRGLPLVPAAAEETGDGRRAAAGVVNGLLLGVVERAEAEPTAGDIAAIDHVVVSTTHLDRIVAVLGGRLGLDLRLEQKMMKVVKQLFFRCQNTVVEVLVKPGLPGKADSIWGIAWRADDIEATHARLVESGVEVSEIRKGHKPGTRVATVKDPGLATPTLVIEQRTG
ncbi:VOC family protein [Segniliparus rugosus]|uniref:VOC domain-containing protein n=1 Tax=Segniliparus rugosus (strain ATCC BAA-974 / DSM 45345 / CCUG 50838 / CIP 108380 / JCM 13579 / CDC 945) TaxID=679197 RepID=E5XT66_SEGRC|nr:VOC family protein [Segniliparus rugosus]EFV12477.1 hypothetical protein HMPREF9336_02688 [Segniliparus rugosus ATCC BAA-974]